MTSPTTNTADMPLQRVAMVRSGVELPKLITPADGGPPVMGMWRPAVAEIVTVPVEQARQLVYNGAATFVEGDTP